jgi:uncharacterized protein (DUF4213/DUF364 family)
MPSAWSQSLRDTFSHIVSAGDFKAAGLLNEEKTELLAAARAHWHAQGRRVLDSIPSADQELLAQDDVLVVAGAEMIDLKSLERILAAAERARAKLVLLADSAQLREMSSMSAMHDLIGVGQLTPERR